jgi:hypothetical protein
MILSNKAVYCCKNQKRTEDRTRFKIQYGPDERVMMTLALFGATVIFNFYALATHRQYFPVFILFCKNSNESTYFIDSLDLTVSLVSPREEISVDLLCFC